MPNQNDAPEVAVAEAEAPAPVEIEFTPENRLNLADGTMLIPRPDYGNVSFEGEERPVAKIALDIVARPPRVFELNEETKQYELLEGKTIDTQTGNIVGAAPEGGSSVSSPSTLTVDLTDDDDGPSSGQGGVRGVTKTGGSNVDLNNDEFYSSPFYHRPSRQHEPDTGGKPDWEATQQALMEEMPPEVREELQLQLMEVEEQTAREEAQQLFGGIIR